MTTTTQTPAQNQIPESAMRRLKKLLALAMDSAAAPGEAENAMRMAQKLMESYNVTAEGLARAAIKTTRLPATKAEHYCPWELAIMQVMEKVFGVKYLWCKGVGPRGARPKGSWAVVGEENKLELVEYAYGAVARQLMKARSDYVSGLPDYYTRPEKAARGDAFGVAFAQALEAKVSALTDQDPATRDAIAQITKERTTGFAKSNARTVYDDGAGVLGSLAGAQATLHRPVGGSRRASITGG